MAPAPNFAIGNNILTASPGPLGSIGIGFNIMTSLATGVENIGIGINSLTTNEYGSYNIAIGNGVLNSNTTGAANTAVGNSALNSNSTGAENTAIGYSSLSSSGSGYKNVAIGYNSLKFAYTTIECTAVGADSLIQMEGEGNTAIGSFSGSGTQSNYCTFLGASTLASSGVENSVAIGHSCIVTTNNSVVLGNSGSQSSFVGIGTSSPEYALHIGSDSGLDPEIFMNPTGGTTPPPGTGIVLSAFENSLNVSSPSAGRSGRAVTARTGGADDTCGRATLNGTVNVVISTTAVRTDSIILLTPIKPWPTTELTPSAPT